MCCGLVSLPYAALPLKLLCTQATKNVLDVARERGASHFVLLSAICVQKPLLEFQRAKLKLEADLQVGVAGGRGVPFSVYLFFNWEDEI